MIGIILIIGGIVGILSIIKLIINNISAGNPFDVHRSYGQMLFRRMLNENIARSDAWWNSHKDISDEERRAGILADRKFWREQYEPLIMGERKKDEG